ncbi:hypothetical protein LTR94_031053, partial [Friedmanniomyces endolithicus]
AGNEALRVLNSPTKVSGVNRLEVSGAATGFSPVLMARGEDDNITLGYDAKGTGSHRFTHDSNLLLDINGQDGANAYVEMNALAFGFAAIVGKPTNGATTADLLLAGTGTGSRVRFGTYTAGTSPAYAGTIEIRDADGNARKLMVAA